MADRSEVRVSDQEREQVARRDLPRLPATKAQQKAELAERRSHLQRRLIQQTGGSLTLFAICTGVWISDGASGQFWPIWVALIALIPLVRNGWALYGPAPDIDKVERELNQRAQRDNRRGRGRHR